MNEALLLSAALLIAGPRTEIPPEQAVSYTHLTLPTKA